MGMLSFLVDISLEVLNGWKFNAVAHAISVHGGFAAPYAAFSLICACYAAIAGALVSYAAPLAAGSGIPEVKTYLNGVHVKGTCSDMHTQCLSAD